MSGRSRAVYGAPLVALLLIVGCSLHYRRADYRWPATSGPSDLKLRVHALTAQAKVGEPIPVTVSLVNTADTLAVVHLQDIDGGMQFDLVNSNSDTWRYRIRDWVNTLVLDPEAFYGIEPGDSTHWRYLMWPQRFYRQQDSATPGPGTYRLVGRLALTSYSRNEHLGWSTFVLRDTADLKLVVHVELLVRLHRYRSSLNTWFRHSDRHDSAGDRLLADAAALARVADTTFPYTEYLLVDVARNLPDHESLTLSLATRFLARYPNHCLSEELRGVLPWIYGACGEERKEDSLAADFITMYPRNAAALHFEPGRRLWRERFAVPPPQRRDRRLFLGIPGPWGPWRDWHHPLRPAK